MTTNLGVRMGLTSSSDRTFLEFVREVQVLPVYGHEVYTHLPEDLNLPNSPEDSNSSDENSDNESVMPELTNSSDENSDGESVMPELADSADDEEDEFDFLSNGLRLPFAYVYFQRTEFQARGRRLSRA